MTEDSGKPTFSTSLRTISLTIDGKDYVMRELTGKTKGMYLNSMGKIIEVSPEGKVKGIKDFSGLECHLLKLCLFDEDDNLVSVDTMSIWPSSVLGKLFEMAQELSGLTEAGQKKLDDEAKNS